MKYAFIGEHEDEFSIVRICKVMRVSRSGYYAWRKRPQSKRAAQNQELLQHIHYIHMQSRQAYGAKKTWLALNECGVR